jgi:hypothetical protein
MGLRGINDVIPSGRGLSGVANELHPRVLGAATCFAVVASLARADYVVPIMLAAEMTRDNMIYGQLPGFLATVLAGVAVSNKYLSPCQPPLRLRALDQIDEANY